MATFTIYSEVTLFAWLISHQPAVLFSQNEPATSNQSAVLFSQKKSAPAISHQPTEQAVNTFAEE
jgi:predicted esterase